MCLTKVPKIEKDKKNYLVEIIKAFFSANEKKNKEIFFRKKACVEFLEGTKLIAKLKKIEKATVIRQNSSKLCQQNEYFFYILKSNFFCLDKKN